MADLPAASVAEWGRSEPDWKLLLTDELDRVQAAAHWERIGDEMRLAGRWTPTNDHAITRLAIAYILYDRAARNVMEHGTVIASAKTKVPQYNLHFVAMNAAAAEAAKLEAELMIAPRRRGKTPMKRAGGSGKAALDL